MTNLTPDQLGSIAVAVGVNWDGSANDDLYNGGAGPDQLNGLGGNDTVYGNAGADRINGGVGNDSLSGGADDDSLDGSAGNDTLWAGAGNDFLSYFPYEGLGNDQLYGEDGNDTFDLRTQTWNGRNETVTGAADGGAGDDLFLIQTDPQDSLTLTGGAGHDTYAFDYAFKAVGSPFGSTVYQYTSPNTAITDFAAGGASGDRIDLGQLLVYSATVGGDTGGNPFSPASGYLRLVPSGADVQLQWDIDGPAAAYGFATVMVLRNLQAGALSAANFTADNIAPSVFVENLNNRNGSITGVYEKGFGFGDTRLSYGGLDPLGAAAAGAVIAGFTGRVIGSVGNDSMTGSGLTDYVAGSSGHDSIAGNDGSDVLLGGPGNDTVYGGAGDDYLLGETGNDRLYGEAGNDTLYYSTWNDSNGADTLDGGTGADHFIIASLNGVTDTSTFLGGDGNDQFDVRTETQDTLLLSGGSGTDTFLIIPGGFTQFSGSGARITDFLTGVGGDLIDLHKLIDISAYKDASDPGGYIGGNPFNPALGYLRLAQSGADTLIQWDKDGAAGQSHGWLTVFALQGISANSLTRDNFVGGLPPDGSAVAGSLIVATPGVTDTHGGYFNDTLMGLDSQMDRLYGEGGDDLLNGMAGDQLDGGPGNDTLLGGAGDDLLTVVGFNGGGRDQLDGGADNDYLEAFDVGESVTLSGGEGNDQLRFIERTPNSYTSYFFGNGGADRFVIGSWVDQPTLSITGGSGRDTYAFDQGSIVANFQVGSGALATDFVPGPGGDLLDFTEWLTKSGLYGYAGGNPFEPTQGFLRFVQVGADTAVQWDVDGVVANQYAWDTVLVLQGVAKESISADNIVGKLIQGSAEPNLLTGTEWGSDRILSFAGNDTLDGLAGSDYMEGGPGADTYYLDSALDQAVETDNLLSSGITLPNGLNVGSATDKVIASVSHILGPFIENLELVLGKGDLAGGGNELANQLTGNEGDNALTGGAGDDTLRGGDGNDAFLFAANGNGIDRITDFSAGDAIRVAGANFSGSAGTGDGAGLLANQIRVSAAGGSSTLYIGTDANPGFDIEIRVDGGRSAAEFVLAGSQVALVAAGKSVDLLAYSWKAHTLLDAVTISGAGHSASTVASGGSRFTAVTDATLALSASRQIPGTEAATTSSAVNLQDAIAILKMIVGLDVNGPNKPISPYQTLAADFDGNGTVGLTDAIGVLKHVVGLPAPDPVWKFANEVDATVAGLAMTAQGQVNLNPGLPPAISADLAGNSPVHVGLVGYLRGDVDGSYNGAAGALDLDNVQAAYFSSLIAAHSGLSLAQFGIYPP